MVRRTHQLSPEHSLLYRASACFVISLFLAFIIASDSRGVGRELRQRTGMHDFTRGDDARYTYAPNKTAIASQSRLSMA